VEGAQGVQVFGHVRELDPEKQEDGWRAVELAAPRKMINAKGFNLAVRVLICLVLGAVTSVAIAVVGCWFGNTRDPQFGEGVAIAAGPSAPVVSHEEQWVSGTILAIRVACE
jgi:hypothetical protein